MPHSSWGLCRNNKELPIEWLTPATIHFSITLPESVDWPWLCCRLWADSGSAAPVLSWDSGLRCIPHLQHAAAWRTQRNHRRLSHTVQSYFPATQRWLCHAYLYSTGQGGHMAKLRGMCYREGGGEYLSRVILSATVTHSFITYLLSASIVLETGL